MENLSHKEPVGENPLVSIITVSFNAGKTIEATIKSIINQSYENIEYIIIDGESTDNTIDIIKQHQYNIKHWVSEADTGVYDAMNKGIDQSSGDWIIFLGADDKLFDKLAIEKLIKTSQLNNQSREKPLAIFGNTLYSDGKCFKSFLDARTLVRNTIQHQSAMYHKSLFDNFRYDSSLRICSDYELNLLVYIKHVQVRYINSIISICSCDGLSSNFDNRTQAIKELIHIQDKHLPSLIAKPISVVSNLRILIKFLTYKFVNTILRLKSKI
jgi:putative colanic acid biosynthesis glycosyltransferase